MIAGFLILGLVAALGSSVLALALGYSLWMALLAYMLGGMIGVAAGLVQGFLCAQIRGVRCPGLSFGHLHQH